jgi:hypothetical protein
MYRVLFDLLVKARRAERRALGVSARQPRAALPPQAHCRAYLITNSPLATVAVAEPPRLDVTVTKVGAGKTFFPLM